MAQMISGNHSSNLITAYCSKSAKINETPWNRSTKTCLTFGIYVNDFLPAQLMCITSSSDCLGSFSGSYDQNMDQKDFPKCGITPKQFFWSSSFGSTFLDNPTGEQFCCAILISTCGITQKQFLCLVFYLRLCQTNFKCK